MKIMPLNCNCVNRRKHDINFEAVTIMDKNAGVLVPAILSRLAKTAGKTVDLAENVVKTLCPGKKDEFIMSLQEGVTILGPQDIASAKIQETPEKVFAEIMNSVNNSKKILGTNPQTILAEILKKLGIGINIQPLKY